jgi:hypothetical protein
MVLRSVPSIGQLTTLGIVDLLPPAYAVQVQNLHGIDHLAPVGASNA